jgi:hypothetical protein
MRLKNGSSGTTSTGKFPSGAIISVVSTHNNMDGIN